MHYVVRPERMKDPRVRAMINRRDGETERNSLWTSRVVNEWARWIIGKHPGKPWKEMRDLYGKHQGETILVCGAGPSVKRIKEKPALTTIAINRAIQVVPADYWAWQDEDSYKFSGTHPNAMAAKMVCITQGYKQAGDRPAWFVDASESPTRWANPELRPIYGNQLTLTWVIHLCLRMGARRVVTIGCEFDGSGHWDGFIQPNHTKKWQVAQHYMGCAKMMVMMEHHRGEWQPENPQFEVVDASGGNMPVPKVRLEEVLV